MKKYLLVAVAVMAVFSLSMFGCAKKNSGTDEYQEAMSLDALGGPSVPAQAQNTKASEPKTVSLMQASPAAPAAAPAGAKLESLPPGPPYKPSMRDIQTALKNAGYYTGEVDGKTGKMTKKAIEDFQSANGLEADGKVGPKTWAVLSTQLNAPAADLPGKKR